MPVGGCPRRALSEFTDHTRAASRVPLLFGIEPQDLHYLAGWTVREIGRQPLFLAGPEWAPQGSGPDQPRRGRELRRQARRAQRKGVQWLEACSGEVWEHQQAGRLDRLFRTRWERQPLAELSFLVTFSLSAGQRTRRYFLLHHPDRSLLGLAILTRSQRGWLLEHQVLDRAAPNGSGELLVSFLLTRALRAGELLSLGITPLYRALMPHVEDPRIPGILSVLPSQGRTALLNLWEPLYGFRGLQAYREKLEPQRWEPVYWAHPEASQTAALGAVLQAFAGGSLRRFLQSSGAKAWLRACHRLPRHWLRGLHRSLLLSLGCWIPILAQLDGEALFGWAPAPQLWALYDLVLWFGFLLCCPGSRRSARGGRSLLTGLVLADALLSTLWLWLHPLDLSLGWSLFRIGLAAAPWFAVLYLWVEEAQAVDFLPRGGKSATLENP